MLRNLRIFCDLIRFEHTLFALPYAVAGAFVAARGAPEWPTFLWIVVAMVAARTAAMTFNRLVDRRFDAQNPRTAARPSVTGAIGPLAMVLATVAAATLFFVAAGALNRLALALAGPTLAVLLFYSVTKRFWSWTHLVLGIALGLSPLGAWVAVRGTLVDAWPALWLAAAVVFWTAGFDVLYACQDADFDRKAGLRSIPARLGLRRALVLARMAHALVPLALAGAGVAGGLGYVYFAAIALVALLLVYEHSIVGPDDLARLNRAFFTVNVAIGFLVLAGVIGSTLFGLGAAA
jgi:4-hydroxybenzoate polyprenyltransferase